MLCHLKSTTIQYSPSIVVLWCQPTSCCSWYLCNLLPINRTRLLGNDHSTKIAQTTFGGVGWVANDPPTQTCHLLSPQLRVRTLWGKYNAVGIFSCQWGKQLADGENCGDFVLANGENDQWRKQVPVMGKSATTLKMATNNDSMWGKWRMWGFYVGKMPLFPIGPPPLCGDNHPPPMCTGEK